MCEWHVRIMYVRVIWMAAHYVWVACEHVCTWITLVSWLVCYPKCLDLVLSAQGKNIHTYMHACIHAHTNEFDRSVCGFLTYKHGMHVHALEHSCLHIRLMSHTFSPTNLACMFTHTSTRVCTLDRYHTLFRLQIWHACSRIRVLMFAHQDQCQTRQENHKKSTQTNILRHAA